MCRPLHHSAGFTLVEVLITAAVLVILAGVLFPIVSRSRENARKAQCTSNLRQLGLAWQMYADDSDGRTMPSAYRTSDRLQLWTGVFLPKEGARVSPDTGLLQPWLKTDKVLLCPSWTVDGDSLHKDVDVQGYGYNSSVFRSQTSNRGRQSPLLSAIERPAELAVFADAANIASVNAPGTFPSLVSSFVITAPSAGSPRFHGRHNGVGNVVWADGHVKAMRPVYIEAPRGRTAKLQQEFQVGFIDRDGKAATNEFFELNPTPD